MRGRGGGRGQLQSASLVDGIGISNHMAKHRNAVSVNCRVKNVASACNAGGSSSLYTRMNAAARLIQPLQRRGTHLKINQRFLQQASYTHSARKHWHHKSSAQHSTRAAAAAPALNCSCGPASHAPSPTQPSPTLCRSCAYRQARWQVAGTRTPHSGT